MPTFSDFYAEAQRQQGGKPTLKKSSGLLNTDTSKLASSLSGHSASGNQDPLSWLVDIISRPLYSATNSVNAILDSQGAAKVASEKFRQGDVMGGLGDALGATVNMATAPLRGFWSTDEKDKHLTNQLIEKGTDVLGPEVDSSYKDVQDNVNPIAKGILGFAGDVGLDPLTYIPGGALLSAGKGLVKGTSKVARILTKTPASVDRAAEKAVDAATKTPPLTAKSLGTALNGKLDAAEAKIQAPVPKNLDLDAISYIASKDRSPAQQLAVSDDAVAKALRTPEASTAKSYLKELSTPQVRSMAKAVVDTKNAKPLTYGTTSNAVKAGSDDAAEVIPGWRDEAQRLSDGFEGKLSEMPKIPYGGKNTPIAVVLGKANAGDAEAVMALRTHHQLTYQPAFVQAARQGKLIDAFGREVKPTAPVQRGALETVTNSLQNFQQKMIENEGLVREQLGPDLTFNLAQYHNAKHFDSVMTKMSAILEGSTDVHTLKKFDSPTRRLLQQIGIDPLRVPLGIRKVKATKNIEKPVPYVSPTPLSEGEQAVIGKMGKGSLTEPQQLAEDSLREAGFKQFVEPRIPDSRFITTTNNADALRTSKSFGEGDGLLKREFNTYANYNLMRALGKKVTAQLRKNPKLAGPPRAFAHKSLYMAPLRLAEDKLEELGVPIQIGIGDERILLSPSQILDHLNAADRTTMNWSFWNSGTAVPPTNLLEAVVAAVGGKITLSDGAVFEGPAAIRAALVQTGSKYADKLGNRTPFMNALARIDKDGSSMGPGKYGGAKKTGDELVEQLATLIEREAPSLRAISEENAKAWIARTGEEFHDLTDKELAHLQDVFQNAKTQGSLIQAVHDIPQHIADNAAEIGATQKATNLAGVAVGGTVEPVVQRTVTSYVKAADKAESGGSWKDIEKERALSAQERTDLQMAELRKEQDFVPGGNAEDLGTTINQAQQVTWLSKVRTVFDRSYGNKSIHELVREQETLWHTSLSAYQKELAQIQRGLGLKDDIQAAKQAYYNLQHGVVSNDQHVNEIAQALEPLVGQVFGSSDRTARALLDNAFLREGINVDHANSILTRFFQNTSGADKYLFDIDKATSDASVSGRSVAEELAQQWRTHDVEDPIDYLSRVYTGFSKSASDQTLANDFFNMAHQYSAVSRIPKPGYARVADDTGESVFAKYLPDDVYIDSNALRQLHVVDSMMRNVLKKRGPVWDFLNDYYVPALDLWKWGNTLPNPTHHARNFVGDSVLTVMANGLKGYRSASKKALQAMATRNAYDGYDAVKALQGIHELPNAGKILTEGRLGKLSAEDYLKAAAGRGNLPTYQILEQLETTLRGTSAPARAWEKLTSTKGAQVIGGISEARDHYVRLVHFIQYTEQRINSRKYASLNDLLDEAAESTRKWHPDGSDLTNAEQYFKLVIPFYSWTRKAIPLVAESILTRPGRVNAFNKGSYNLAVAMGVNPQSLSDPFPEDQMFPSYLTNQASGPQFKIDGKYFGVSPGIATWDVMDMTLAGNPLHNILGQVNPLLKAPAELATGVNLGTGGKIHDWSDYLDSSIPGLAQGSRLTGTSPTGSVVSLLEGKGLDPQYQVAKGNKQPIVSVINYLTGLGILPMSENNAISYAQFEQMNKGQKGANSGGSF